MRVLVRPPAAWSLVLIVASILAGAGPATAQFYDLDGVYRCVIEPTTACEEALREHPPPPPPLKGAAEAPTLDEAIAHVRGNAVTPHDLELIRARAAARDGRAVEVLAWCKLSGIGMPADAVAAYGLYGEAVELGVPHARDNQIAIYETKLTPDQRQAVLVQQYAR